MDMLAMEGLLFPFSDARDSAVPERTRDEVKPNQKSQSAREEGCDESARGELVI